MKKVILLISCIILLVVSCAEHSTELTDEQKATIISEVEEQYNDLIATINQIDIDAWTEFWSENEFISVNSQIDYFSAYNEWIENVAYYFSLRESQDVQLMDVNTTVLSSDLVLLTSITTWNLIDESGEQIQDSKTLASLLWKKLPGGWKVIYLHESWQEDNE